MCSVSAVMDYGQRQFWPHLGPNVFPTAAPLPSIPPGFRLVDLKAFEELVRKAAEYDRITGQPNCEDPMKAEVLRRVEERIAELERRVGVTGDGGSNG